MRILPKKRKIAKKPSVRFYSLRSLWWTSLALHLYAAWCTVGFQHCDEHFQILEPLIGNLSPWEFIDRIRPWFQITLYKLFLWPWQASGLQDPFFKMALLRIAMAILGFFSLNQLALWWSKRYPQSDPVWTYALIHLAWFVPYLHARTSSENLSTSLFLLSLVSFQAKPPSTSRSIWAGVLGGCAFSARFHLGLPVFLLWCHSLWHRRKITANWAYPLGVVTVVGVGFVLDSYWYGQWTFSPYRYFHANLVQDKASSFGVDPWYQYLEWGALKPLPPLSLVMIICLFLYWWKRPGDALTWVGLPFFLMHSLIPHKEYRFLFPLLPFAQLAVAHYLPRPPQINTPWKKVLAILFLLVNTVALVVSVNKPAQALFSLHQQIYNRQIQSLAVFPEREHKNPYSICFLDMKFTNPRRSEISFFDESTTSAPTDYVLFYHYGREKLFPWIADCQLEWKNRSDWWASILPEKQLRHSSFIKLYHCPQNTQGNNQ